MPRPKKYKGGSVRMSVIMPTDLKAALAKHREIANEDMTAVIHRVLRRELKSELSLIRNEKKPFG